MARLGKASWATHVAVDDGAEGGVQPHQQGLRVRFQRLQPRGTDVSQDHPKNRRAEVVRNGNIGRRRDHWTQGPFRVGVKGRAAVVASHWTARTGRQAPAAATHPQSRGEPTANDI